MTKKTIILAGPSAIGKTYLSKLLISEHPSKFEHSEVYTTRPRRKNEDKIALERIFISDSKFDEMVSNNNFVLHETFARYRYGYTEDSFIPKNKNLIVDVSPWLIPKILDLPNLIIVGLQAPNNYGSLLEKRMIQRGDSSKIREERHIHIQKDVKDLQKLHNLIEKQGKLFEIENDQTIIGSVVPWIKDTLKL